MATDFTKMPLDIVTDLINLTNDIGLVEPGDIIFGPVSELLNASRNTSVTIYAAPGSRYTGLRDLTYNRVDMSDIPRGRSTEFDNKEAQYISQLIPDINTAYSINLQPEDYINEPLPSVPVDTQYYSGRLFTLKAAPDSYVWRGKLNLSLKGNKIDLATYLPVDLLSGFDLAKTDIGIVINTNLLDGFDYQDPALFSTSSTQSNFIQA